MIKRELGVFLIVGLLTVAIDFTLYRGCIYLGLESINLAKGLGFIGGTIFAYFANRFWTFKEQNARAGSISRFILVYIMGLSANILVNYLSIVTLKHFIAILNSQQSIHIAFILATGVSAAMNFVGMKFFAFTDRQLRRSE